MSTNTVYLVAVEGSGEWASLEIDGMSHQFKMFRRNATAYATNVIPFKSLGGFSYEKMVGKNNLTLKSEVTITINSGGKLEGATICPARINLAPKSLFWGFTNTWSILIGHLRLILSGVEGQDVDAPLPHSIVSQFGGI